MDHNKIYKKIEEYVTGLFHQMHVPTLVFHDLEHTQNVVKHTQEIAGHYNVSENDMLILFTSAWFHDTGHLFTEPAKHEEMSCEIMKKFMKDYIEDEKTIEAIEGCIMATKMPRILKIYWNRSFVMLIPITWELKILRKTISGLLKKASSAQ
jgi:Predicted HD superfamily hydrolase